MRSYRPSPTLLRTRMTHSPSSTAVPAYTSAPTPLRTASGSPVMLAWLTIASPSATSPSKGMRPPVRTTTRSSTLMSAMGQSTSAPSAVRHHTCSMGSAIERARSSTVFLCVQSSSSSPTPSMKTMEEAVSQSPRTSETITAAASSTGTSSLPRTSVRSPSFSTRHEWTQAVSIRSGAGRKMRRAARAMHMPTSLSSNSRVMARLECGTSSAAAVCQEKPASAESTAARSPR